MQNQFHYWTMKGQRFYARSIEEAREIAVKQYDSTLNEEGKETQPAKVMESAEQVYERRRRDVAAAKGESAAANVPGEDDYQRREREKQEAAKR